MPGVTAFPSSWQTQLAKPRIPAITVKIVYDPDGLNIAFTAEHGLDVLGKFSYTREMDVQFAQRPTAGDVQLTLYDPDGYFRYYETGGPFHESITVLHADVLASASTLYLRKWSGVDFEADQEIEINDGTNSETLTVDTFSTGTYYDTLTIDESLENGYSAGTQVYTKQIERKIVQVRLSMAGCTEEIIIFTGRIVQPPEYSSNRVTLTLCDNRKYLMDSPLVGADSSTAKKLMMIDTSGDLVSSVKWNNSWNAPPFSWSADAEIPSGIAIDPDTGELTGTPTEGGLIDFTATVTNANNESVSADIEMFIEPINKEFLSSGTLEGFTQHIPSVGPTFSLVTNPGYCRLAMNGDFTFGYNVDEAPQLIYENLVNDDPFCIETKVTLSTFTGGNNTCNIGLIVNLYESYAGNYRAWVWGYHDNNTKLTVMQISRTVGNQQAHDVTGYAGGNTVYLRVRRIDDVYYFDYKANEGDSWTNAYSDSGNGMDVAVNSVGVIVSSEASQNFAIDFDYFKFYDGDLAIQNNTVGDARIDEYYQTQLIGGGGVGGYTFALSDGALPNGINLTSAGLLYGTPIIERDYTFTIQITDGASSTATKEFTMTVQNENTVMILPQCPDQGLIGVAYSDYLELKSSGDFDRTEVTVLSGCRLGTWTITFVDSRNYTIEGPGATASGDIDSTLTVPGQLQIPATAWSGSMMAGDSLQFKTAISWENENVAQIFYDLLVKIGIAEKQIAASSYFGAVEIGTLYEGVSGGTTVKVAVNIPIVIATGETIILSEGVTSEELVVSAGNAEATSYPPYITLTTGTISNTFTTAATVTWKKRTSLDTGFNFDEVYDYFDRFDYVISHCFDRELSYLQAAEIIGPHGHCFNFTDMMGRERIHVFKPVYESIDQVSYNDTLLAEGLTIGSAQIINRLVMNYAFDCENDEYTGKLTYPNDDDNLSYIRNGFLREKAVYLPGWYNAVMAERVAAVYFNLLQRGLKLISFQCKIDEMFRRVGERVELVSYYPQFSEKVEIIGVGISVDPKSDIMIEFVGYAYEAINNNVFYLDVSKMDNGAVLW